MVQFASYLGCVLCKTHLIFPGVNGPNVSCFCRACCRCANVECGSEYDMDFIEIQLIDMVQKLSMAFVLQDLKCTKCRGVC